MNLKLTALLLPCLLTVGSLGTVCAAAPAVKPNVLFIAVDDLRPELGCYGVSAIKSPNIDGLAQRGLVLDRAYCQQAVCSPSRSSLLAGTRPDTTKVYDLQTHFRKALPDLVTLPQLFKNQGYFTIAMGKIYHHGLDDPASWSVPTTFPRAPQGAEHAPVDADAPPGSKLSRGPAFRATDGPDNVLHDGELADMAVRTLASLKTNTQPWFLAVGFLKPHLPFVSPKKYWDLYDPEKITLAPNPFRPKGAPSYAIANSGELRTYDGVPTTQHLPDNYARQLKHGYYAAVSYMDAQVGRVLAELDRLGLRDNTIVILWGDHGWKLGEHDAWAKHSNVENDTHAPLILSVPGMKSAGKHSAALVEFVDIYPTLADLAGLSLPSHLEGISFKPLLDDPNLPWKSAAFSQYPRTPKGKGKLMGYSMRTDRYRFTVWASESTHDKVDAIELYDHQTDPQENENLANHPDQAALVKKLMVQWKNGWRGAQGFRDEHPSNLRPRVF
ncbi:MAG: hypothetical protein RLY20_3062 [Verrucomicrobiota bacterium]|jgi:arylsulfatase A-like enzyme